MKFGVWNSEFGVTDRTVFGLRNRRVRVALSTLDYRFAGKNVNERGNRMALVFGVVGVPSKVKFLRMARNRDCEGMMGLRAIGWLLWMTLAASAPIDAFAEVVFGRPARPGSQGTFDFNSDGRNDFTIGTKTVFHPADALAIYFAIEQPVGAAQKNGVLTDRDSVPGVEAGYQIGANALLLSWDDEFVDLKIPGVSPADAMLFLSPEPSTQSIGVRFHANDGLHYGWVQLARNRWGPYDFDHPNWPADPGTVPNFALPRIDIFEIGVIDWAYESTAGVPIVVGAVPEAGTVVLGVVGAVVAVLVLLRQWRVVGG
jgi:hypothetical protein